jgi:oligosaccharide repeat unit polymerase
VEWVVQDGSIATGFPSLKRRNGGLMGLLNLLVIVIVLVVAGNAYARSNFITPWPGFLVSFCTSTLIGYFFIPASLLVIGEVGNANIIELADTALTLNLLGLGCCSLSFYLFSMYLEKTSSRQIASVPKIALYDPQLDIKCMYICSATALVVALVVFSTMLYAGVFPLLSADIGAERAFVNRIPEIRPIYNFAVSLVQPIIVFSALVIFLKWKEISKLTLIPLVILCGALLLTGTRSFLGGILESTILGVSLLWIAGRSRIKISYFLFLLYQLFGIFLGGVSGLARDINFNNFFDALSDDPLSILVYSFTYAFVGNNLCELRDFSWVLSKFDGSFFGGKTLLAGIFGFVPSSILPFREEFTFARVTNSIVGLPSETSFGTRASFFGEWYFNFNWPGVLLFGLIVGVLLATLQSKYYGFLESCKQGNIQVFTLVVLQFCSSSIPIASNTSNLYYVYVQALFLGIVYLSARSNPSTLVNLEDIEEIDRGTVT